MALRRHALRLHCETPMFPYGGRRCSGTLQTALKSKRGNNMLPSMPTGDAPCPGEVFFTALAMIIAILSATFVLWKWLEGTHKEKMAMIEKGDGLERGIAISGAPGASAHRFEVGTASHVCRYRAGGGEEFSPRTSAWWRK